MIPGLSKAGVAYHLEERMKIDADSIFKGRSLSGWYFQQLLKLGVSRHIDQLSSLFLLWDMDMIPVRPLTLFQERGRAEQLPYKVDADLHSSLHTQRALLQIGGSVVKEYELSYERLFEGNKVSYAPDGSSLVVHHMLVYKPIMHELIHHIGHLDVHTWRIQNDTSLSSRKRAVCSEAASVTGTRSGGAKPAPSSCMPGWSTTIIDSANERELTTGFSEYTTYASYALQKHPRLYATASTCTWRRTPYLYYLSARIVKFIWFDAKSPCCPTPAWLLVHRWLGFEFIGYEIGHEADVCLFDPQQQEYGL